MGYFPVNSFPLFVTVMPASLRKLFMSHASRKQALRLGKSVNAKLFWNRFASRGDRAIKIWNFIKKPQPFQISKYLLHASRKVDVSITNENWSNQVRTSFLQAWRKRNGQILLLFKRKDAWAWVHCKKRGKAK